MYPPGPSVQHRGERGRRFNYKSLRQIDWHNASQTQLPTLMESRVESWGPADVDAQGSCPFYNGRLPREITDLIFEFALTPDTSQSPQPANYDFGLQYDHERGHDVPEAKPVDQQSEAVGMTPTLTSNIINLNYNGAGHDVEQQYMKLPLRKEGLGFDWFRPGDMGRDVYHGQELLRTCRRAYLDTHALFEKARATLIYDSRGPPWRLGLRALIRRIQITYKEQLQKICSLRWFVQMYRLEEMVDLFKPSAGARSADNPTERALLVSQMSQGAAPAEPFWWVLHHLQYFHMTIRRSDWDRWEDNKALTINPYRRSSRATSWKVMRRDMHTTMVKGEQPQHENRAWGKMFRAMRNLKMLTISLETSEDKKDEMEEIVEWAKTWRFEIRDPQSWLGERVYNPVAYLVADGKPVRKMSWRGLRYHWSDICHACGSVEASQDCAYCLKKQVLLRKNKGPRLLMWTLSWTPKPCG